MKRDILLPAFETANVLVYGDIMLDRYWYGDTERISPEAPVPIVSIDNQQACPGGAANVALNIAMLASKASLFGLVGDDINGQFLRDQLQQQHIDCFFQPCLHHSTVTKLRVLSHNQQLIRLDFDSNFYGVDDETVFTQFQEKASDMNAIIFSDYAKGTLQHIEKLIAHAKQYPIPILVDPKSDDLSRYAGATLITPNRKEFERAVGKCSNRDMLARKAKALLNQVDVDALLITLGKEGLLLCQSAQEPFYLPARSSEVFDVTGAGDTVIAVLGAALAAGESLQQAALLANTAAGIVVGKLGAASTSVPEIRRALQQNDSHFGVLTESELMQALADARVHGEVIVMTNGCFDLLHAGHVQYLEMAKKLGDRLIVAVNDDESVSRLKGLKRPINSLRQRMEVLASLRSVDWVLSFKEDTPAELLERILPDILVKGGDYKPEDIAGGNAVLKNGGTIKILPFLPECSTSSLINKMKAAPTLPHRDQ